MKPIKMFGLAALAALMAMAFVGASAATASSTLLCAADQALGSCTAGPSHIHETSVGKAKLLASPNVECNVLFLSTSIGVLGTPQIIEGNFSYSSCTSGCSVNEENGPAEIRVLRTGHETASIEGEALVHVNCFGFINCRYNGTGLEGTAKGPLLSTQANGEITLNGQEVGFESGAFCPEGASLDITTTALTANKSWINS